MVRNGVERPGRRRRCSVVAYTAADQAALFEREKNVAFVDALISHMGIFETLAVGQSNFIAEPMGPNDNVAGISAKLKNT